MHHIQQRSGYQERPFIHQEQRRSQIRQGAFLGVRSGKKQISRYGQCGPTSLGALPENAGVQPSLEMVSQGVLKKPILRRCENQESRSKGPTKDGPRTRWPIPRTTP